MDFALNGDFMQMLQMIINSPMVHVGLIVVASLILFISDKLPMDAVAYLVLVSLLVLGLVPENQILTGFSNTATMTVAGMFVVSAGLQRTGIVQWIANRLSVMVGKSGNRMSMVLMSCCGFLSAFVSNTATVAVLLPVSIRLCRERDISPGRVLMPLSFAAQFGGVCTLIGTTTNLLVNSVAKEAGLAEFSIFEFGKLGVVCFVAGTVYMLVAARFLDRRTGENDIEESEKYRLQDYLLEMRVLEGSPLIGQTGDENELRELGDLSILEIVRSGNMIWAPQSTVIRQDDVLLIRGPVDTVMEAEGRLKLEDWAEGNLSEAHLKSDDIGLLEVMIPLESNLIGRSLSQLDFYWRYHAAVLGIRRRGAVLRDRVAKVNFERGDTLLLQGHRKDLQQLSDEKDFIPLQDLSQLKLKKRRALLSISILAGVLIAATLGVVSLLTAVLVGAAIMIGSKCLTLREAYSAIDMRVIMLLACLIPLGVAMQNSGASDYIANHTMEVVGVYGPHVAMGTVYLLTMILTALMSNTATAVLVAPLAIGVAQGMGISAAPFLMAVTFAASTCFSTPVGYQTNAMVYGPGGYRYSDYLKIGLPLNILFFVISVTLIPLFWPF